MNHPELLRVYSDTVNLTIIVEASNVIPVREMMTLNTAPGHDSSELRPRRSLERILVIELRVTNTAPCTTRGSYENPVNFVRESRLRYPSTQNAVVEGRE